MGLRELLKNKIEAEKQVSRDTLRFWARHLKTKNQQFGWDSSSTDRKLRMLCEEGSIQAITVGRYNIAYRAVKSHLSDKINDKPQKPMNETEKLNNSLKAIIRRIPANWANAEEIRRIDKIIRGKNNYLKRAVIAEYKKYANTNEFYYK